jgi:hypothetical protein
LRNVGELGVAAILLVRARGFEGNFINIYRGILVANCRAQG